jgi:hypothetical protein
MKRILGFFEEVGLLGFCVLQELKKEEAAKVPAPNEACFIKSRLVTSFRFIFLSYNQAYLNLHSPILALFSV